MARYRLKKGVGSHREGTRDYKAGQSFLSSDPLAEMWPDKFEAVVDDTKPVEAPPEVPDDEDDEEVEAPKKVKKEKPATKEKPAVSELEDVTQEFQKALACDLVVMAGKKGRKTVYYVQEGGPGSEPLHKKPIETKEEVEAFIVEYAAEEGITDAVEEKTGE